MDIKIFLVVLALVSCKFTPCADFTRDGKGYEISTYCVRDSCYEDLVYGVTVGPTIGNFTYGSLKTGLHYERTCDCKQHRTDTTELQEFIISKRTKVY